MRIVGVAAGTQLFAPADSFFSYFNSPFIGHRRSSSVDVYPSHQLWGGLAFSPVDGRVHRVRKLKMGMKKVFPTSDSDYAIAIIPDENEEVVVRVLHCQPSVSEGDLVGKGDSIGELLRSRYFCFWTRPHYHIEVMDPNHFQRSSQSFPLNPSLGAAQVISGNETHEFECEVISCTRDGIVAVAKNNAIAQAGDCFGHLAVMGDDHSIGIIDAGIPHYKHGGVIGHSIIQTGGRIRVWNTDVGQATDSREGMTVFSARLNLSVFLGQNRMRGISHHIYSRHQLANKRPPIFLIPPSYGQYEGKLNEGDWLVLSTSIQEGNQKEMERSG
ncbi:MAG: hypothetical protein ACXAEE_09720 [Candidatus Thorarchaeota archaeon]|jgi:hypothetical protein